MKRCSILAVAALCLLVLSSCGTSVPNVVGMPLDEATQSIKAAGFTVGDVSYDEDSGLPQGSVSAQEPQAGERVKDQSLVALTIAGPPPVPTPDLLGLDSDSAQSALRELGLTSGTVTESFSTTAPAGTVISQTPSAAAVVRVGTAVAFELSKGPEPVPVPAVIGMMQAEAEAAVVAANLTVTAVPADDQAGRGTVLAQTPAAGELVLPGTPISITVSTGIVMVKVPNVYGVEVDEAERRVRAAGLSPTVLESVDPDGPIYVGEFSIHKQEPAGGKLVPRGSTVKIWYWWRSPESN